MAGSSEEEEELQGGGRLPSIAITPGAFALKLHPTASTLVPELAEGANNDAAHPGLGAAVHHHRSAVWVEGWQQHQRAADVRHQLVHMRTDTRVCRQFGGGGGWQEERDEEFHHHLPDVRVILHHGLLRGSARDARDRDVQGALMRLIRKELDGLAMMPLGLSNGILLEIRMLLM